ncbi:LysR family transcriptional regulator [Pandoraea fibrosis]|uniref:LysR family transcriptional regulator n=1 Tax=Pandoraea fibrosis TaxID=1891094 RepID=A0ABX6HPX0_9BURK|nr:winged helix-turn-helix domain-containing protein [Pandoraea fibrosis]QHE93497.1 LysR family transcriptional regulator [Pandoraea fibrosis]QHF12941.1 LysR family transcriptional regulator [Pandoraea fibrosis]
MPVERRQRKAGRPEAASKVDIALSSDVHDTDALARELLAAAEALEAAGKAAAPAGVASYDVRVRIRDGDTPVFGPGRLTLLRAIDATGSISAAARRMGMSYRRAWLLVEAMNHEFREPLVTRHIGGVSGGGAQLTPFAQNLTAHYDTLIKEIRLLLDAHVPTFDAYLKGGKAVDPDEG